jgi:hypothetical protein
MKAQLHTRVRRQLPDGSIISIVIWLLPEESTENRHRFKYGLNYSAPDGTTLVRYDNERGKGDHKHLGGNETAYQFETVRKLVEDFFDDVTTVGGQL